MHDYLRLFRMLAYALADINILTGLKKFYYEAINNAVLPIISTLFTKHPLLISIFIISVLPLLVAQ